VITQQPIDAYRNGDYNTKVPVLLGTNSQEGVMFVYGAIDAILGPEPLPVVDYVAIITVMYKEDFAAVLDLYPAILNGDNKMPLAQVVTDYLFYCPNRQAIGEIAVNVPAFMYYFNHSLSFNAWGPSFNFCQPYVCHGAELPFVFNSAISGGFNFTAQEEQLSVDMVNYWTNFAHSQSGSPNTGLPVPTTWPTYSNVTRQAITLATPVPLINIDLRNQYCDFWDTVGYHF